MTVPPPTRYTPKPGDLVIPDTWKDHGGKLYKSKSGATDLTIQSSLKDLSRKYGNYRFPVKVTPTGRKWRIHKNKYGWCRVKIEFVKDGSPNDTVRGWLFSHDLFTRGDTTRDYR